MTCQYWSQNKSFCYLQDSKEFGNYVNILSAILSAIAAIFEFIILFLVKDLELYGDQMTSEVASHPIAVEMQPISSDERDGKKMKFSFSSLTLMNSSKFYISELS